MYTNPVHKERKIVLAVALQTDADDKQARQLALKKKKLWINIQKNDS